jgi:hypothetical protein
MSSSLFNNESVSLEYYWRTPNTSVPYSIWSEQLNAFKLETIKPVDVYFELFSAKIFNAEIDALGNLRVPGLGYLDDNSFNRYRDITIPRVKHRQTLTISKPNEVNVSFDCTPLVLDQPGSGVFGHIMIDLIPKILLAQKILNCNEFPLILQGSIHNRVQPLFNHFGIDSKRLVDLNHERYRLKELRVVSSFFQGANTRFPFKDLLPVIDGVRPRNRKVWLSRSRLSENRRLNRLLINREEIEGIVQNLGFELIYPEQIPIDELAKIIQETKVLGGESGSALHNILLCPSEGLKLFAVSGKQDFFNQIACANSSGAKFFGLFGRTLEDSSEYFLEPTDFTMAINSVILEP